MAVDNDGRNNCILMFKFSSVEIEKYNWAWELRNLLNVSCIFVFVDEVIIFYVALFFELFLLMIPMKL